MLTTIWDCHSSQSQNISCLAMTMVLSSTLLLYSSPGLSLPSPSSSPPHPPHPPLPLSPELPQETIAPSEVVGEGSVCGPWWCWRISGKKYGSLAETPRHRCQVSVLSLTHPSHPLSSLQLALISLSFFRALLAFLFCSCPSFPSSFVPDAPSLRLHRLMSVLAFLEIRILCDGLFLCTDHFY